MSSSSVLKALGLVTGAPLKYFSLVKSSLCEDYADHLYLCLGKHSLFLVDGALQGAAPGGVLHACPYKFLERCEADVDNAELFALHFLQGVPLEPHLLKSKQQRQPEDSDAAEQRRVKCFPKRVVFRCTEREKLFSEMETHFRADYMFQHWQLPQGAFVVDTRARLSLGPESDDKLPGLTTPHDEKLVVESLGPYVFLKPKSFERQSVAGRSSVMARYVNTGDDSYASAKVGAAALLQHGSRGGRHGKGSEAGAAPLPDSFDVYLHEAHPISKPPFSLTIDGEKDINKVAEFYMREIGSEVVDYRIIDFPARYVRQRQGAQQSRDMASSECWKVHMRTNGRRNNSAKSRALANRDIVILVMQRKFIPPMMDTFQNMVVVGYSHYGSGGGGGGGGGDGGSSTNAARAEAIVDSLTFNSQTFTCDTLVVQTKADALMLDEESYAWYAHNLEPPIYPAAVTQARAFCLSILKLLSSTGLPFSADEHGDTSQVSDDPFEHSTQLENQVPGLLPGQRKSRAMVLAWKDRVRRYLAFCVDGGLLPGVLDIPMLATHVQQHPRRLQRLSQLLQMLLSFRAVGTPYHQTALALKIADERLMQNFTFNGKVMEKLLASGYIKRVLDDTTDPLEYPRFIVRLLQRGKDRATWGYSLQYTVCKQLARSSAVISSSFDLEAAQQQQQQQQQQNKKRQQHHPQQLQQQQQQVKATPLNELALHTIVPALIDLLNDESSNDQIQVLVVSTLVNFTRGNVAIKNKVMAGGAIKRICLFLHSKNDDLVRHSCSLLNNCTKSEQYRGQVAKFKAAEALMRLLQRNSFPPHYRPTRILIQACAVIGNLAMDTHMRHKITGALGYEVHSDKSFSTNARFEQSRAIRVLVDLLLDDELRFSQRDSLRVTVVFALKNLALRHEENKRTIGRLAIEALLGILDKKGPGDDKNQILIDTTLRCVYVLSFERSNAKIMLKCNVEKVLQARSSQPAFGSICRHIQKNLSASLQ